MDDEPMISEDYTDLDDKIYTLGDKIEELRSDLNQFIERAEKFFTYIHKLKKRVEFLEKNVSIPPGKMPQPGEYQPYIEDDS